MPAIATGRLTLIPLTPASREALLAGRDSLPGISARRAPDSPSADLLEILAAPDALVGEWGPRLMLLRSEGTIVGDIGFHTAPNEKGEAEIGYSVAPAYRGRGLATEAVRALVAWAFGWGARAVVAHCARDNQASGRVLSKAGFVVTAVGPDEIAWRQERPSDVRTSYDYAQRSGELSLSWEDVGSLARELAEDLAQARLDTVVGIARAGLIPAAAVAAALRLDLFPVRVTRRERDIVAREHPSWKVPLTTEVVGRRVGVVDEIADTGETLALVAEEARRLGAGAVRTACLVQHSWSRPRPDHCPLVSDALVVFPWDAAVLHEGFWVEHPEIAAARLLQREAP